MRRSKAEHELSSGSEDRSDAKALNDLLRPGDSIAVSFGREVFSPIKYNTFEVGPFTATTTVREHESATEALARASEFVERVAREQFDKKLAGHLKRVRRSVEGTKRVSRGE